MTARACLRNDMRHVISLTPIVEMAKIEEYRHTFTTTATLCSQNRGNPARNYWKRTF